MTAASVPTGTKRRCEIQGQERQQDNPAELIPKRYPNTTNRRGVVCPVRNLVFVSGMVGEDENEVLMDGLEAQCERAFLNMKNVLESAGSSLEKVLFCQIFIGKREDRAIANKVWDRYFLNMDVAPARYTVVAPTVAEPYLFEITCVAGV